MIKYPIYFVCIIIINFSIKADSFFFDNLNWIKDKEDNGITLYSYENNDDITSYKAEKIINNFNAIQLYKTLLDFKNYPTLFPRTLTFEKKYHIENNKYLFYSLINFSPLKNRDYFIELEYYTQKLTNGKNIYILRWIPYKQAYNLAISNNIKRVQTIYGRWTIKELGNNNLYISVEYHNDFKINAPKPIINAVEKKSIIKAIENLLNYVLNLK